MNSILVKGVIRNGRVEVTEPIDLPEGSEVTIIARADETHPDFLEKDRPMTPSEMASALAAMAKVEPFDITDEERADADAWEKRVNDYTIANGDKGIEDVLP